MKSSLQAAPVSGGGQSGNKTLPVATMASQAEPGASLEPGLPFPTLWIRQDTPVPLGEALGGKSPNLPFPNPCWAPCEPPWPWHCWILMSLGRSAQSLRGEKSRFGLE